VYRILVKIVLRFRGSSGLALCFSLRGVVLIDEFPGPWADRDADAADDLVYTLLPRFFPGRFTAKKWVEERIPVQANPPLFT
jgi:hypothetical protein